MKKLFKVLIVIFACLASFSYADTLGTRTVKTFFSGANSQDIAIDHDGNLWIVNDGRDTLTELDSSGTVLRTIMGLGQAYSLAVDPAGNIWVPAAIYNTKLPGVLCQECLEYQKTTEVEVHALEISPSGDTLGDFLVTRNPDAQWQTIAIDSQGNVFINNLGTIFKLDSTGNVQSIFHTGSRMSHIVLDKDGNLWAPDSVSDNIHEINGSGSTIKILNVNHHSASLALDAEGNIWVGTTDGFIERVSPAGPTLANVQSNAKAAPVIAIKADSAGNIWAINQGLNVLELNSSGAILAAYPMPNPVNLAIDSSGNVWVINHLDNGNGLYKIENSANTHP